MTIIRALFLFIFLFGLHSAKAIDFERDWKRHASVRPVDEQLRQYLSNTASDASLEEYFKNLDRKQLKDWFLPFLKNKTERPVFRSQYLLELFTNLHDSAPNVPAKHRLSDIQHYWMSSQNRHMPLSNRIAGLDEQRAMVNALGRHVNRLIGQHFTAESHPDDIFQIVVGDLADTYLGKAASTTNLRHRKHYKICYLVSALMALDKLLDVPIDTPSRERGVIFGRFSEIVDDSIIKRAQTLMGLADKVPQAPFPYKTYLESHFAVQVKTDTVPVLIPHPAKGPALPVSRPIVTVSAEPSLDGDPSKYIARLKDRILAGDVAAISQFYDQEETGILEVLAENSGEDRANLEAIRRHLAAPLVELPVAVTRDPVIAVAVQTEIEQFINSSRAGDAARKELADRRERVHLRDLKGTELRERVRLRDPKETELIEYENGADGDCGLFVLGVDREAALKAVRNGTFKVLPILIEFGQEDEVRKKALRELSVPKESVSADVLISIAYTFGKNASIWDQSGAHLFVCEENAGQTLQIVFVDANRGSGHYARLVPVNDIKARIWAKTVEDHVEEARRELERFDGFDISEAEANYVRAQYFTVDAALNEFAEKISQTLRCPKATVLSLISK